MRANDLFQRANQLMPGGVNSPVRSFSGVGGEPVIIDHAKGPYVFDVAGQQYIDYVGSWGPMILGHADPSVVEAVTQQAKKGLSYGAPCLLETRLAEAVIRCMPSIEKIRFVNSGTEASMSALRLARAYTSRDKIIKFAGCYHGHADALLVEAGSGALTLNKPSSDGVPQATTADTLVLPYNDVSALEHCFANYGHEIAGVIVEPIAGNMNLVKPTVAFLNHLRLLCDQAGAVLIFDEVMTGFRVAKGGAQALYDIKPDLTCLGKVIGGGMPVGAFAGPACIMDLLAPLGPVYQAGTLSGNPMAMAAGLATLVALDAPNFYEQLQAKSHYLMAGFMRLAHEHHIPLHTDYAGGMFGFVFTHQSNVQSLDDIKNADIARFKRFFHHMLARGIYLAPSAYEAGFMSMAHQQHDLDATLQAAEAFFKDDVNS